jgi:hypothetical protein
MKIRNVLIPALLLLVASCSGGGDPFPEKALKGAEGRAEVRRYKEERGLSDPNRRYLAAEAFVYHDVERGKLRPTALTILKRLKERFSNRDWIVLRIYDDERAAKMLLPVVVAELKDGKAVVSGWTPSPAEIDASSKDPAALAGTIGADGRLVFTRPSEEDYNLAVDADARSIAKGQKRFGRPSYWQGPPLSPEAEGKLWSYREEPEVEKATGSVLNVEPLRVRVGRYNVYMYYAGYAKGKEP